jgi:phosphatidylserine/phosphatidylglycerophosphate/cardiolipin synthase-like enzyme
MSLENVYNAMLMKANHRKLLVVDGLVAFTGSQNVTDSTYNLPKNIKRGLHWVDLMARFEGTEGWISVDDNLGFEADPPSLLGPYKPRERGTYEKAANHIQDFLKSIRTRRPPVCNAEVAHRAVSATAANGPGQAGPAAATVPELEVRARCGVHATALASNY